jgi:hypothetical protein
MYRSLVRPCTRICARTTIFLVLGREERIISRKIPFSSRKSRVFWNEKERFEIDDFAILSLARLPIPPPRQIAMLTNFAVLAAAGKLRL